MNKSFSEKFKGFLKSWEFVLIMILLLEVVVFATKNPKFLKPAV